MDRWTEVDLNINQGSKSVQRLCASSAPTHRMGVSLIACILIQPQTDKGYHVAARLNGGCFSLFFYPPVETTAVVPPQPGWTRDRKQKHSGDRCKVGLVEWRRLSLAENPIESLCLSGHSEPRNPSIAEILREVATVVQGGQSIDVIEELRASRKTD